MPPFFILVVALVATCLIAVLVILGVRASKLAEEIKSAERKLEAFQVERRALAARLAKADEEDKKKIGLLDHQEQDINWLRAELDKRPTITRKMYRILTLGIQATGKTSLALKWSNPLIDLGTLEGTKIERYERTVSLVTQKDVVTEHVFEVHDWGGEHIVDAQQELIVEEIHGLLLVVDLGGKDAKEPDMERIREQLQEFQPQALKYFFGPKTLASCKTVVLFINKSDLLAGTPSEVEAQAKKLYAPLIEALQRYSTQIDVRILVGSASFGHSTHMLFSHFVEQILPRNAYDNQLLQRMKSDFAESRAPRATARTAARAHLAAGRTAPLIEQPRSASVEPLR